MKKTERTPPATVVGVAAICALIGFAAVYFTLPRPDNAAVPETGAPAAPSAGSGPKPSALAGFVTRKEPLALADVGFTGPGGVAMKLSDFKGKAVLLNLWATWCAPCRKEMPSLDRLQKAMGTDTFEVVALAVDRTGAANAAKFLADTKVESLKLYVDATAKAGNALGATGMPTTILIGKDGREIGRLAGPAEWDSEDAKRIVEAALR